MNKNESNKEVMAYALSQIVYELADIAVEHEDVDLSRIHALIRWAVDKCDMKNEFKHAAGYQMIKATNDLKEAVIEWLKSKKE